MTGYTRQDLTNNIANGQVIDADTLDNEFDAIEAAFNSSTGHSHDGTSAGGASILTVGPAQELVVSAISVTPKASNTYDLGSSLKGWKDFWVSGNATIANLTCTSAAITGGVLNSVTINNSVIGGVTPAAITGTVITAINRFEGDLISDGVTITGGTINGTAIGGTTPAAIAATTVNATSVTATTLVGDLAGDVTGNVTGNTAGTHTGAVVGDVTGNVTGNITGNVTSSSATITGGSITGITDLAVADGGTGASTAAGALVNLGLTATAAELNVLDGITASTTELNYVDGVTSSIQTQLNAKQATDPDLTAISALTSLGFLTRGGSGVYGTSDISAIGLADLSLSLVGDTTTYEIDVPASSLAQAEAGSNNTTAMTPLRTNQAIAALMTTTQTLGNNGRVNFASGLQLRWGSMSSTVDTDESFSFHYPFSNACYIVITSIPAGNGGITAKSDTGFTFNRNDSIDGTETGYYFAIGS